MIPQSSNLFRLELQIEIKYRAKKFIKKIPIQIQGVTLMADLFSLPLGGVDVVLGIQWLESLGQVITDYGAGTMEFSWGEGRVVLKAAASELIREVNIDTVERIVRQGGSCYAVKIEKAGLGVEGEMDKYHPYIKQVLIRFLNVLQEPRGLPPEREFDHNIPLKDEN